MATVAETKADLVAALDVPYDALGTDQTVTVYDHEPRPGDMQGPVAITVSTSGWTPTEWVFAVRIYVTLGKIGAKVAQDALDELIPLVDAQVATTPTAMGPSQWSIVWEELYDAVVATNDLSVPRDDF